MINMIFCCLMQNVFFFFPPDTGGGNALNVKRTVQDLMAAGAAGCFLEVMDSSSPCLARTVHHMFFFATINQ